jgi:NDP-sugar pyrophosphorylase family protein
MKAVILAGGKGTRLAPYTTILPKPLVPVGDLPILEIIIKQLIHFGFKEVVLMVGYLSGLIKAYFDQRPSITKSINITYISEETPTGTAGSLGFLTDMTDSFLVMNGDILTTLNYKKLLEHHERNGNKLTIAMHQKKVKIDLGVLDVDENNRLRGYDEKPEFNYNVSMGIYVYHPAVLHEITKGEYLDFPTLAVRLKDRGEKVEGFSNDARWLDIGRIEDFNKASDEFEEYRSEFFHENE